MGVREEVESGDEKGGIEREGRERVRWKSGMWGERGSGCERRERKWVLEEKVGCERGGRLWREWL